MSLTKELLQANETLQGLSDEQIAAVVTLSQNDEEAVIGTRIGEIYGGLDADILAASGIEKNGTEKTYNYAKRVIGVLRESAAKSVELQGTVDTLTKEKQRLEKSLAEGATDAATAAALKQAKADLAKVTADYNSLHTEYEQSKSTHAAQMLGARVDYELQAAAAGLKFKAGYSEQVAAVLIKQATEKLKGMSPELTDDGKTLVFKDSDGAILRNKANLQSPMTAAELLMQELDGMGVLDKGRKQTGTGTSGRMATTAEIDGTVDISGARTRSEAVEIIHRALVGRGLVYGTAKYLEAERKAWKELGVNKLPENQ